MRIALHATSEIGMRAGRILLAERELVTLGLLGRVPRDEEDPRLEEAGDLAVYDVLVTDDANPADLVSEALEAGIDAVTLVDADPDLQALHDEAVAGLRTLVAGANLASGIAPTLASHERARVDEILDLTIAWTEPGTPLRRGEPAIFPDPVGPRWARRRDEGLGPHGLVAPVDGRWAAASVKATGSSGHGVTTRLVGVADLAPHLEAIALAAAAVAAARGAYAPGVREPADAGEAFLTVALAAGLEVATHRLEPTR